MMQEEMKVKMEEKNAWCELLSDRARCKSGLG